MIGILVVVTGAAAALRGRQPEAMEPGTTRALAGTVAVSAAYVIALQVRWLPYVLATVLFIAALGGWLMWRGRRRWGALAATACGVAGACHLVFTRWLVIDLP
jgi:hypothetical protein